MKTVRIENWCLLGFKQDLYLAPELKPRHLMGQVYGHPSYPDGENIRTSIICDTDGINVYTANTHYVLGKASNEYREWYCQQFNEPLNEANPFREVQ